MNNAISLEISNVLKEKYSYLNKDEIFNEIGNILSKYKITEKEIDTRAENDFNEKISLFCLDKKINGNSKSPYNRLANRSIQKEFEKIVKNAGLPPNICLHMTRHTTASKMIRNGASIITVQKTLGHSDPNTTMCYITQDSNSLNYEYDKYMS